MVKNIDLKTGLRLCDTAFLAEIISYKMKVLNLSQTQVARDFEIERPILSKFLNKKIRLHETDLYRLIKILRLDKMILLHVQNTYPFLSAPLGDF